MDHYAIFDDSGAVLREVVCYADQIGIQLASGESALPLARHLDQSRQWKVVGGRLVERPAATGAGVPATDAELWMETRLQLNQALMAGYPSSYGPIDLRPGAKQAMLTAIALGRGLDLILLDNRIVSLNADQLAALGGEAFAWEQARVMEAQNLRPSSLSIERI
ncbi:hypothetical protein SAMN02927924_01378 [Sphingobium faniae]|nr:hypothetical protein SAMN02927924_01378 [Sphingobium faniae]